jgi:RNA polymerase sigma factor (sigma-70 family)
VNHLTIATVQECATRYPVTRLAGGDLAPPAHTTSAVAFEQSFRTAFADHFQSVFRYLDRLTGDDALAADVAQDAFARLYLRGAMPDDVRAWLAVVSNNLLRDERRRRTRRIRLLSRRSPDHTVADPPPSPDERVFSEERRLAVRAALAALSERDQQLLLLRHEGMSYRQLAAALALGESSVGVMLARACAAFRAAVLGGFDAT